MYHTRYLILFFILTSLLSCSINKHTRILWKATSPQTTSPIYILGTNHDEAISVLNRFNDFDSIFKSVDLYMTEITPEEHKKIRDNYSYMPQDSSYKEILSEEDYDLLVSKLHAELGDNFASLLTLRPSIIQLIYTTSIKQKYDPSNKIISPDQKMDFELQKLAKATNKEILSLDDESTQFFTSENIGRQIELLMYTLKNEVHLRDQKQYIAANEMKDGFYNAYRRYDLGEIYRLNKKSFEQIPDSVFLDDEHKKNVANMGIARNKKWVKKIDECSLRNKSIFVFVGVRCTWKT